MEGVVNGVLICQQQRTQELNDRIYKRNIPTNPVQMQYDPRSVSTKFVHMPTLDCHPVSDIPCDKQPVYNTEKMFTPSNSLPFSGYQANVDTETRLRDTIFPLQSCPQARFIPSSKSDMFNSSYLTQREKVDPMTNTLLFKKETFSQFNPNNCKTGYKLFNNHTRVQIRNLP